MREETNKNADQQIFKRTASNTKTVNLGVRIYRGGTRLWSIQFIVLEM